MDTVVIENPSEEQVGFIVKGLNTFNEDHIGKIDSSAGVFVRDEGGNEIGGLKISFQSTTAYIHIFWVAESHRGRGHGTLLLRQVERIASERGAKKVYLSTFSFQAPNFYEANGFVKVGSLIDYPQEGVHKYYYCKSLGS